jgi:hypothetical protein
LKVPGFNHLTYEMMSCFQAFVFHKCHLRRYIAALAEEEAAKAANPEVGRWRLNQVDP